MLGPRVDSADDGRVDSDSRARTHLANERTFLAWLRTGLTMVGLGVAAAQLLTVDPLAVFPWKRAIALALVSSGVGLAVVGAARYRKEALRIDRAQFGRASHSVLLAALVVSVLGLIAVAFIATN